MLRVGQVLGTSAWQRVGQDRIDAFAQVTGDHQWIHVDPERARHEGPFAGTVAHGAFVLSLVPVFIAEVLDTRDLRLVVNGGLHRVRFRTPVPAGARVRGKSTLLDAGPIAFGWHLVVRNEVEIDGAVKPACVADQVLVLHV
ncbi:MaoC family dehydratase [Nocardia sp. NPDC059177]|uniref:MaoC family dehydratase n=1 Tax=Nocardia sp. NPDC059177 TaxID=3346759 RepID=UPI0036B4AEBB